MSPSRIPRPGQVHGSPTPNSGIRSTPNSPNPSSPLAGTGTTSPHQSHFKPNNPFAQRVAQSHSHFSHGHGHSHNQHQIHIQQNQNHNLPRPTSSPNTNSSPPANHNPSANGQGQGQPQARLQPPMVRRRPKPPAAEYDDLQGVPPSSPQYAGSIPTPTTPGGGAGAGVITRRPVPNLGVGQTQANSDPSMPRMHGGGGGGGAGYFARPPAVAGGVSGLPTPPPTPGQPHRSCLRQPSTPSLSTVDRRAPQTDPVRGRTRALSAATGYVAGGRYTDPSRGVRHGPGPGRDQYQTAPNSNQTRGGSNVNSNGNATSKPLTTGTTSQHLFEHSFTDREPAVPPHIRVRLKLIHQLGVVLGVDAAGISGLIDIPGLLARVDAAYDRDRSNGAGEAAGVGRVTSTPTPTVQASGLPLLSPTLRGRPSMDGNGAAGGGGGGVGNSPGGVSAAAGSGTGAALKPSKSHGGNGVLGMFRRLGGRKSLDGSGAQVADSGVFTSLTSEGPAFGVPLNEIPNGAWCTSLIGGQKHELPLVVFTIIEEIYRRGMSEPGIFRLAGDGTRISHLTKVFNLPPLYGDSLSIASEPIHNLTGLVKRYVRDLPEPILDESIFPAFVAFCIDPEDRDGATASDGGVPNPYPVKSLETRITAAQILLRLLPPLHFSLFVYLLAFLGQLPLYPDNRLNTESISIIFGPAMCAARGKGIAGLGPSSSSGFKGNGIGNGNGNSNGNGGGGGSGSGGNGAEHDPEMVSELVNTSQGVLGWLLKHSVRISEKVLDGSEDDFVGVAAKEGEGGKKNKEKEKGREESPIVIDPRLLSPIDLRSPPTEHMQFRRPSMPDLRPVASGTSDTSNHQKQSTFPPTPSPTPERSASNESSDSYKTSVSDGKWDSNSNSNTNSSALSSSVSMSSSTSMSGLFSRAFSSRSISSNFNDESDRDGVKEKDRVKKEKEKEKEKVPKRSASFTSLSSLVKKGTGGLKGKSVGMGAARSFSDDRDREREAPKAAVNSQITNVLGSLHDLLVSKDKQIERDARELALLRHTLLEMDEKLQRAKNSSSGRCTCSNGTGNAPPPTPAITITSTPSLLTLNASSAVQQEITDLQSQLTTALAALETSRLAGKSQTDKILDLEARLSRLDGEKKTAVGKLEVALAVENAKLVGLIEERDLARERLEKIKTTLFAVA